MPTWLVLVAFVAQVLAGVIGVGILWRQTADEQRDAWSRAAGRAAERTSGTAADLSQAIQGITTERPGVVLVGQDH